MLWHRYGTVLHLLASTDLKVCARKFNINQMEVEDVVQTVKVLQQIKGFEEEDLPAPDYDTKKELDDDKIQQQLYASKIEAYNYHESNFYNRYGGGAPRDPSVVSNYNQSQNYNSQNPYPRQHKLLKSQIMNGAGIDSNNTLERNLDVTSMGSKLYDVDGGASVYVPIGASSIQTYNSNYFHSKYRQNKKNSYNKSLDVVFRRRWHALSQGKGHQIKQKPRVKVNDIFIHQVSNNIQQMRQSKQSFRSNNEHTINIDEL